MKIKIPGRNSIPECELYVEILRDSVDKNEQLGKERPVMFMLPGSPGGNHTAVEYLL